jgi:hypothetical protein
MKLQEEQVTNMTDKKEIITLEDKKEIIIPKSVKSDSLPINLTQEYLTPLQKVDPHYQQQNITIQNISIENQHVQTQHNAPVINQNADVINNNNTVNIDTVITKDNSFFQKVIKDTWAQSAPKKKLDYILPIPDMNIKKKIENNELLTNFKEDTERLKKEYFGSGRKETFEDAVERLGVSKEKYINLKKMYQKESIFFRFSFYIALICLLIGLGIWQFNMIVMSFSFMLFTGSFLFSRSFRLWQLENQYLGSVKEFLTTEGFMFFKDNPKKNKSLEKKEYEYSNAV